MQVMKFPLVLLLSLSYSAGSLAGNWDRIMLWGWDGKSPKAFGSLEPAPNRNGCYGDEITNPDKAMVFDVTKLAKMAGSSFDVHNIYVDSVGEDGGYALGTWINHWHSKGYGYELVPEGQYWESSQSKVLVCVGTTVWAWVAAQYLSLGPLKKIFLCTRNQCLPLLITLPTLANQCQEHGQYR
jgi:hypothetical protein